MFWVEGVDVLECENFDVISLDKIIGKKGKKEINFHYVK